MYCCDEKGNQRAGKAPCRTGPTTTWIVLEESVSKRLERIGGGEGAISGGNRQNPGPIGKGVSRETYAKRSVHHRNGRSPGHGRRLRPGARSKGAGGATRFRSFQADEACFHERRTDEFPATQDKRAELAATGNISKMRRRRVLCIKWSITNCGLLRRIALHQSVSNGLSAIAGRTKPDALFNLCRASEALTSAKCITSAVLT